MNDNYQKCCSEALTQSVCKHVLPLVHKAAQECRRKIYEKEQNRGSARTNTITYHFWPYKICCLTALCNLPHNRKHRIHMYSCRSGCKHHKCCIHLDLKEKLMSFLRKFKLEHLILLTKIHIFKQTIVLKGKLISISYLK